MSIVANGDFNKLIIDEGEPVHYYRLITLPELIDRLQQHENVEEPLFNGNGIPIEKWHCLGRFVSTAKNIFSILIGRQDNSYVYRGENTDYKNFIPTALRDSQKDIINNCICWVQKQEFLDFFKTTPYYNRCKTFQVFDCFYEFDLEAVSQHYGFISNYIDITKDLYIAMFFAYTKYNPVEDKYYPITDFKDYSPTLYISNIMDIYKTIDSSLKVVGFQSVLRPRLQHAMALDASNLDLKSKFEVVPLPKSAAIAQEVYNQFRGGESIFPTDYMAIVAQSIRNSSELNENYVAEYCSLNNIDFSDIKEQLQQKGYKLSEIKYMSTSYDEYMMNRDLDDYILPTINECIAVHPVESNLTFTIG